MDKPFYEFEITEEALRFEFESVGKHVIKKVIVYEATTMPNIYNLAMGDLTPEGYVDDEVVSNNGDRNQILATIAQTLLLFFDRYPNSFVVFSGSTPERTRLYQIVISRELHSTADRFNFWGLNKNGDLERFIRNKAYIGFIISLKTNSVEL